MVSEAVFIYPRSFVHKRDNKIELAKKKITLSLFLFEVVKIMRYHKHQTKIHVVRNHLSSTHEDADITGDKDEFSDQTFKMPKIRKYLYMGT